jgi:nicotinate-nucleotide--dimethylbenzimidazole phosphoribosyltransferase
VTSEQSPAGPTDGIVIYMPDPTASYELRESLGQKDTQLGVFADAVEWAAGVQGANPPHPFGSITAVVVAADHGLAAHGVSADPPAASAERAQAAQRSEGPIAALATRVGATIRVVDAGLDTDELGEASKGRVRRGSGVLGEDDVLSWSEAAAAFRRGRDIADAEADAGTDLLVPLVVSVGASAHASAVIAAIRGEEPAAATGRGSGIDDETWMRKCAAIRDGLRRARPHVEDEIAILAAVGGSDLAVVAGLLTQAAVRKTPVLLDGVSVLAAALLSHGLDMSARQWWLLAHRGTEPAEHVAARAIGLEPLTELQLRLGDGTAALAVLPLLQWAISTVAE